MTAMSFADSMNSLDAMNDDDVVINEIRLPSAKSLLLKIVSTFKPNRELGQPSPQFRQQQNLGQQS